MIEPRRLAAIMDFATVAARKWAPLTFAVITAS